MLKFNPSKTKVVYFSRNANAILLKLFFQGDRLECVQVHRHLDLLLSHNLSWSEYIFHSRKAYKKLRLLKNENSELEGNICQNLYISFMNQLLNTPQLFGTAALLMILKCLKKYSYLQLALSLVFPFLYLENPFTKKRAGKLYKIGVTFLKWLQCSKFTICVAPSYLKDIIPDKDKIFPNTIILFLDADKNYVPDSMRLWNLSKADAREAISITSFRKNISVEIVNPLSFYAFGKRFINII